MAADIGCILEMLCGIIVCGPESLNHTALEGAFQKMKPSLRKLSVVGSLMFAASMAAAAETEDPKTPSLDRPVLTFSGFGTVGLAHSSEKKADYTSSLFKPRGAGYTRDWSFDVDSRVGAQLDVSPTPQLSAVLQILAEQRYDGSYKPSVEWANVKYRFTPDFDVRVGRIVLPGFMLSEYRKVGYAMPWVRPPGDVYQMFEITNSDGIDLSYRARIGEATNTLHGYFGRKDIRTVFEGNISEARKLFGVTNTMDFGTASVRLGYYRGQLSMPSAAPLFDAFRLFGPRGSQIADRYELTDKPYRLVSVGANYDPGTWFLMGEIARQKTNSWLGDRTGWYVSSGVRFNQFTPYVIISQVRPTSPTSDPGVASPFASEINLYLNLLLRGFAADQKTVAIGGRWDIARNTALKLQYDRIDIRSGSLGTMANIQPGYVSGGKVNIVSIALDFVF